MPPYFITIAEKSDNNIDQMSPASVAALDEQKVDGEQQQHKQQVPLEETSEEAGDDACGQNNNDNIIKQDKLENQTSKKKNNEETKNKKQLDQRTEIESIKATTEVREIQTGASLKEVTPSPTSTLHKPRSSQGPKSHSVTFISPREDEDQEKDSSDLVPRRSSWFAATLRRLKPIDLIMPSLLPCTKADPSRRASKQIDKQLNKWNKKQSKVIQLLLIGLFIVVCLQTLNSHMLVLLIFFRQIRFWRKW